MHVVRLKVLDNNSNRSTSLWKNYDSFKYIIFDEGMI